LLFRSSCSLPAPRAPPFQDAPPPQPDKALLYFMRPVVGGGSFWSTHFSVNGTEIVTLTNNGYSWVTLDAGTYQISTRLLKADPLQMSIVLRPGGTHFVEVREAETVDFRYTSSTRRDLLHEIPAATARQALENMKYTAASNVAAVPRN
jgi:uncharacterized protein DUF2846